MRLSNLALLAICTSLVACPGSIDDPKRFEMTNPTGCTLQITVETDIFQAQCGTSSCHDGEMSVSRLDLISPGVMKRLIGKASSSCPTRTIVTPSAPEMSVLLDRLSNNPMCGVRMPLGRDALKPEEVDCVKAWVNNAVQTSTSAAGM